MIIMKKEYGSDYASITDVNFTAKYRARCYCGAVQYEVCSDPVDAKICHCLILISGVYQKSQRHSNRRAISFMVCGLWI
jgi:hypothetical protein